MTYSTQITRLAKVLALGLAIAALVVPAAQAADVVVDDYFRDATALPSSPVVDDYFRDANREAAATSPVSRANVIGDDWFRDAGTIATSQSKADGFAWSDFGIGAGSMLGALVLLTALSGMVLTARKGSRTLSRT